MVEGAYHGFTYGALILNYHVKYGIDAYVEQSAGRGFLDLYFLLRKDQDGNPVPNAAKIIVSLREHGRVVVATVLCLLQMQ
ncbi:hypothetical protein RHORCCE3_2034 [Rickettsia hoogstraalii str. RCCE3]|nr:hypothetical protein RHORCCE3_2034 [Rickettsia hoogstraalii str. RCCE3]